MSEESLPKEEGKPASINESQEEPEKETPLIIPEELGPLLADMPEAQRKAVTAILLGISIKRHSFKSPMPPPDFLKGYNEIIPNGAERILAMSENQSEHRMQLEKTVIGSELSQSEKGQNYGLIIALSFLVGSVFLIYTGHDTAGGILGSFDLVALVSIFIYGKNGQKKSLNK